MTQPTEFRREVEITRDEYGGPHFGVVGTLGDLAGQELDVVGLIVERLRAGRLAYGPFDLANDGRDFDEEARDECLDAAVYLAAQLVRRSVAGTQPGPVTTITGPGGAEWMHSVGHGPLDEEPSKVVGAARPPTEDDDVIRTNCARCGKTLFSDVPSEWIETVNLTADLIMVGGAMIDFGDAVVDEDIAYDWCDVACFGRWLFEAAALVMA
jgi:hypothetical protein